MDLEAIRAYSLRLPHVTESVQWGDDLVFKVGGKMFLVANLEPAEFAMSLKVGREAFYTLQETEGIEPAPYLARAQWLALREFHILRDAEMMELIAEAHRIVWESLSARRREEMEKAGAPAKSTAATPVEKPPASAAKKSIRDVATPAAKKAAKKPAAARAEKSAKPSAKKIPAKKSAAQSAAKPAKKSSRKTAKK
jgi:predicted DNA-binding protein (MmcQ/YjbR family)